MFGEETQLYLQVGVGGIVNRELLRPAKLLICLFRRTPKRQASDVWRESGGENDVCWLGEIFDIQSMTWFIYVSRVSQALPKCAN